MQYSDKDNKETDNNQTNGFLDFCKKNIKYIAAGAVGVAVLIILIVTLNKADKTEDPKEPDKVVTDEGNNEQEEVKDDPETEKEAEEEDPGYETYKENEVQEINDLVAKYYRLYAEGNTERVEKLVKPLYSVQKISISAFSNYIEGFENIVCYTKKGVEDDTYLLSVRYDMKFKDIDTVAPGLDFFYVRRNKNGNFFLDNRYSRFNTGEEAVDKDEEVVALLKDFDLQDDVIALYKDVEEKYSEALSSDKKLKKLLETTIPDALEKVANGETIEEEPAETETPEENTEPEQEASTPKLTETNDTVYAIDNINIRKEAKEDAEKVGSAVLGDSFTRKGTTEDGWSQIEFNGSTAYVKSEFLSTEAPQAQETPQEDTSQNSGLNYVPEGKTITLDESLNIRRSMSEDGEKMGTAAPGDTITVVLSYEEGWTKVSWKDKVGYIKTELLLKY